MYGHSCAKEVLAGGRLWPLGGSEGQRCQRAGGSLPRPHAPQSASQLQLPPGGQQSCRGCTVPGLPPRGPSPAGEPDSPTCTQREHRQPCSDLLDLSHRAALQTLGTRTPPRTLCGLLLVSFSSQSPGSYLLPSAGSCFTHTCPPTQSVAIKPPASSA